MEASVFIFILMLVLNYTTWLFRTNTSKSVIGLRNEGDLDILWLGGSIACHYFQPLQAYNDYGYCAYDYGSVACRTDFYSNELAYARKTHDFDLYIVDLRTLALLSPEVRDIEIGSWTSQLDVFSLNKYDSIYKYYSQRNVEDDYDWIPVFFDIAKTHLNTKVLSDESQWDIANGNTISDTKGFSTVIQHAAFEKIDVATEERKPLTEHQEAALTDLLEYCKKNDMNVLFIVIPYIASKEDWEIFNSASDQIKEYGYNYINANEYVDEMGINYETDFENLNHLNYLGSVKFSKWFSEYLDKNYDLPDHRGDPKFISWDTDYEAFIKTQEDLKSQINSVVTEHLDAKKVGMGLKDINDVREWLRTVKNENFTVIVSASGIVENNNISDICDEWQIQPNKNYIGVWKGNDAVYVGQSESSEDYEDSFPSTSPLNRIPYSIHADKDVTSITVDGVTQELPTGQIKMLVFDDNYQEIRDTVTIIQGYDGELYICR